MKGAKLQLIRRFNAPPERVWAACTRPELLMKWFAPAPFSDCVVEADLRVGGRFFFRMKGEPGTFAAEGVYKELDPPRRLVLTWTWTEGPPDQSPDGATSLVTFEIEPDGTGARMTLTHEGLTDGDAADSHEQGWTECLEKLKRLLDEGLQTQRTTTDGPAALVRAALQAYVDKDRAALAAILSADYRFISPIDNAIALDTYWRICWPNSEKTEGFDLLHTVEDGERAFIVYEMRANGKRFRNAEVHTARDGKLIETQVYFGWNLPHSVPLGQHGTQD